jgi:hypothetical protein
MSRKLLWVGLSAVLLAGCGQHSDDAAAALLAGGAAFARWRKRAKVD